MQKIFKGILVALFAVSLVLIGCGDGGGGDGGDNGDDGDTPTLAVPAEPQPFTDMTATEFVAKIKVGWNLGNTLDANDHGEGWLDKKLTVKQLETLWGDGTTVVIPVTTKSMITAVKNAGFNAIRIPISWEKASSGAPNYTIRADWMARVVEVVNYAVDNDMYIIINTHHDEYVWKFGNSGVTNGQAAFKKIWEQIADTFKNYDEKLIFEGLNEPRTIGSANEWSGGTAEERNNLNAYYPIFVKAVRESGGNNDKRFLMITPYGAAAAADGINGLVLPTATDTASNKLIVSIHVYEPYPFCYLPDTGNQTTWSESNASNKSGVTTPIDRVYDKFVSNGIPVIIGEFGAWDKNNVEQRANWAKFYVTYATSKGIPCFWWDGGDVFKIFNRTNNTFHYPEILAAIMEGVGTPDELPDGVVRTVTINPNVYGEPAVQHGWQAKIAMSELLGSSVTITTGDTFTFTYTFTSDVAISGLQVVLSDTRPEAAYWTELSEYVEIGAVTVGTPVTGSVTITAKETAGDATDAANQFVFNIGETSGAASQPTLTFTAFSLVKN